MSLSELDVDRSHWFTSCVHRSLRVGVGPRFSPPSLVLPPRGSSTDDTSRVFSVRTSVPRRKVLQVFEEDVALSKVLLVPPFLFVPGVGACRRVCTLGS